MKLAIVADENRKREILSCESGQHGVISWFDSSSELSHMNDADAVVDLLFEQNGYNEEPLKMFLPKPVIVCSMLKTTEETGMPFTRINAWPTFLMRNVAELAGSNTGNRDKAEQVMTALGRKTQWVPDVKGFISARVVSMIINEAYFALSEQVSTKKETDIAMKLGTNYPYGPFEWAEKIGLKNIAALLTALSKEENRYQPSPLLLKEAMAS